MRKIFFMVTLLALVFVLSGVFSFADDEAETPAAYSLQYKGSYAGGYAYIKNGTVYVPSSLVNSGLSCFENPAVSVDKENSQLLIDSSKLKMNFADEETSAFVSKYAGIIGLPLKKINDVLYFQLDPTLGIFKLEYSIEGSSIMLYSSESGLSSALVKASGKAVASVIDKSESAKPGGDISLSAGQVVTIVGEYGSLYRIKTNSGDTGYLLKSQLKLADGKLSDIDIYAPKKDKVLSARDGSLTLAWQNLNRGNVGTLTVPEKHEGLEVLAPVWLMLRVNGQGYVENYCDPGYVKEAHEKGYLVWATVNNNMVIKGSTKSTTAIFNNADWQNRSVAQYLIYAALYDLDGLNLDYEDLPDSDAASYVAFTKLLRNYTERQGLALSVDSAIPSIWSLEYDRPELAKYVDYLAVMSYGEHRNASSGAGSVASRSWLDKVVNDCLAEGVPASKLLLGIPTYTYVWVVENSSGKIVEASAVSMQWVKNKLEEKGLTPTYLDDIGQNYIEYPGANQGTTCKIWIEDEKSLEMRSDIAKKYGLAGTAVWQYSYSTDEVWDIIAD